MGTGDQDRLLSIEEAYSWGWGPGKHVVPKARILALILRDLAESRASRVRRKDFSEDGSVQEQSLMAPREGEQATNPSSPPCWNSAAYNGSRDSAEGISGNLLLHGPRALRSSW